MHCRRSSGPTPRRPSSDAAGTTAAFGVIAEAKETADRGLALAGRLDRKSAVQKKARETTAEASEMRDAHLGDDADALDGLEFMIMAEAGELGHVEIVRKMNEQVRNKDITKLATWALKVQTRHFEQTRAAALKLAAQEDAREVEG